jgi:hypothetical protein
MPDRGSITSESLSPASTGVRRLRKWILHRFGRVSMRAFVDVFNTSRSSAWLGGLDLLLLGHLDIRLLLKIGLILLPDCDMKPVMAMIPIVDLSTCHLIK